MNFLQIHIGELDDIRKKCVKSVLKCVGENDSYTFIGNKKPTYIKKKTL